MPYLPEWLRYDAREGPGEVRTPLLGSPADDLLVGDKVPTYRGEGHTFL